MLHTDLDAVLRDLELKRAAHPDSSAHRPRIDVAAALAAIEPRAWGTRVVDELGHERAFSPEVPASLVAEAVATVALARGEREADTLDSRELIARITREVCERLCGAQLDACPITVQEQDLSTLVEAALVQAGEREIAKALVLRRAVPSRDPLGEHGRRVRVVRRSGQVVSWNGGKVEAAVRAAFLSSGLDSAPASAVAARVGERAASLGLAYVPIETVQDLVQEELVLTGHMRVAERYITYRAERAILRAQHAATSSDGATIEVAADVEIVEEGGRSVRWDGADLRARIRFAAIGLDLALDDAAIERELRRSITSGMSRADLRKLIVLNAKALVERDPDYSRLAGRLLMSFVYEEVFRGDWSVERDGLAGLAAAHRRAFELLLRRGAEIGRIAPELLEYDLDRLAAAIDPTADLDFDYLGLQTLYDRYLLVDKTCPTAAEHRRIETPQLFWMRVAMGVCLPETGDRESRVLDLYRLYRDRRFCSSTPTLFNAGTPHSQLSSCYLYVIDDTLESIVQRGIADNAQCSKWAGGLGGSWTNVRGTGSPIHGTNGESQGVVPFLKLHNDQLVAVNQGGKRAGSGCAYLESWHNDVLDFLELRRNTGDERRRTHDMNTANWVPDLLMKRVEARGQWTLFRSSDVSDLHDLYGQAFEDRYEYYERLVERGELHGERIPAIDLWKRMLTMLFETGHPWITFKDACNIRNPQDHAGVVHSSNLCTEITLNTSSEETAVCNLGSIVLDQHLDADGNLDLEKLRETVRIAVRALDNVIDVNFYPTVAARTANERHRPIGLGVMGLQYALYRRGTAFASDAALDFNDEMMEAVAYFAYEASSDLAAERGTYRSYEGSKWDRGLLPHDTIDLLEAERGVPVEVPRGGRRDWDALRARIARQGMRNSNVLAIAPTATISNIVGTSPCIEPMYRNLYAKSNLSGDFTILNPYLVTDLKREGLWSDDLAAELKYFDGDLTELAVVPAALKERYRTAFQIDPEWIIDAAARRQKWIDQSQSLNLWLATPDLKTMSHMYRRAWHVGLKTTYYLRTLGASSIEKSSVTASRFSAAPNVASVERTAGQAACSIEAARNGEECEACQ